jgi:hypothetical protein
MSVKRKVTVPDGNEPMQRPPSCAYAYRQLLDKFYQIFPVSPMKYAVFRAV